MTEVRKPVEYQPIRVVLGVETHRGALETTDYAVCIETGIRWEPYE